MQLAFIFEVTVPAEMYIQQHQHEVLEFVYYVRGCGTTTINNKLHPIFPGVYTITPSGLSHDQMNHTPITSICLGLPKSPLNGFVGAWTDHSGIMGEACVRLIQEMRNYGTQNNRVFSGLLQQILGLAERQIQESPNVRSRHELLIAEARLLIRQHSGRITVSELAKKLHVSPSHLRHIFEEHGEESPTDLIMRARLEQAMKLLANPAISIQEVAYACGFTSPYYFSRFFKEKTGAPPSQIRDHIIGLDKK